MRKAYLLVAIVGTSLTGGFCDLVQSNNEAGVPTPTTAIPTTTTEPPVTVTTFPHTPGMGSCLYGYYTFVNGTWMKVCMDHGEPT